MRACFLGQNICALGYGVALVQAGPFGDEKKDAQPADQPADTPPSLPHASEKYEKSGPVTNRQPTNRGCQSAAVDDLMYPLEGAGTKPDIVR